MIFYVLSTNSWQHITKGVIYINQDILLVMSLEEHPERLCAVLKKSGLSTTLAQNVQAAFEYLQSSTCTFILLDLDLEGALPFLEKTMVAFYDPPPYILAADHYPCSLAQAETLNLGIDICLEKPLDVEKVLAVINAVLRRADRLAHPKPIRSTSKIEPSTLTIDPLRRSVSIDGRPVELTVKEFDILHLLASHPGIVFSKAQIYERVWDEEYLYPSTSVSDMISSMRRKLGLDPKEGRYIQTVFGAGYRFVNPGQPAPTSKNIS